MVMVVVGATMMEALGQTGISMEVNVPGRTELLVISILKMAKMMLERNISVLFSLVMYSVIQPR